MGAVLTGICICGMRISAFWDVIVRSHATVRKCQIFAPFSAADAGFSHSCGERVEWRRAVSAEPVSRPLAVPENRRRSGKITSGNDERQYRDVTRAFWRHAAALSPVRLDESSIWTTESCDRRIRALKSFFLSHADKINCVIISGFVVVYHTLPMAKFRCRCHFGNMLIAHFVFASI